MKITELLNPERVVCDVQVSSKKRALEFISDMMSKLETDLTEMEIYNGLLARERLGSTGLGHGVAIPHGRFAGVSAASAVLVKFQEGVDFDAIDGEPVDIMFGLIVPEESTEAHLELLSGLAAMMADEKARAALRQAKSNHEMLEVLRTWQAAAA